jgi:hypothetical protein
MKKVYALMAAMLFVTFCFAQVAPKKMNSMDFNKKPIMKSTQTTARGEAAMDLIYYPNLIKSYWDVETSLTSYILSPDSNGLIFPENSTPWHPNIYGWGQTYDFTHPIYELGVEEGSIAMGYTSTYTIDTVAVYGGYFRGPSYSDDIVDTLILGIFTDLDDDDLCDYYIDRYDGFQFYAIPYDPTTKVQKNAHIYKLPLTADMVSEEEGTTYYSADLYFGVDLEVNSTKRLNISYAFKRGIELDVDDTVFNYSYFTAWLRTDERPGYNVWSSGEYVPFADHAENFNFGNCVDADLMYNYQPTLEDPSSWSGWYYTYYTPCFFWPKFHYPMILFTVYCDDCEIVNVPEIEKNNPTIYPNPATNNFTVNMGNDEKAFIQLFNIVGQQVMSETITGTAQVNVANLNSGVYMLKINQNGKSYTTKVIVK